MFEMYGRACAVQVDNSGDSALDLLTDADARLALLQSLSAAEGSRVGSLEPLKNTTSCPMYQAS